MSWRESPASLDVPVTPILQSGTNFNQRYLRDFDSLSILVQKLRNQGLRIVLTQGVFDLIHEGHAKYLEMAKSYGDVLIVGVDSDELTRIRKGDGRPIVPQKERIEMLVHLRHVDVVVVREQHHGIGDLIHLVKPDVLVVSSTTKDFSSDMKLNKQMREDYENVCGDIVVLPPQGTAHTSARIRQLTIEGAEKLASEINDLTREFINKIRKS
jgi:D-glycero-beta-D-manno-heptose 1-phosphate adenylyltransferase